MTRKLLIKWEVMDQSRGNGVLRSYFSKFEAKDFVRNTGEEFIVRRCSITYYDTKDAA